MTTFDHVLRLARQLSPLDQARLRAALAEAEEAARAEQIARNQAAIAMLDAWAEAGEEDDGSESWEVMLQNSDRLSYGQTRVQRPEAYPEVSPLQTP